MRENFRPAGGILLSLRKRRYLATEMGALPPCPESSKLCLSRFNYGQRGRGNAL
jgi:hypothetical protein